MTISQIRDLIETSILKIYANICFGYNEKIGVILFLKGNIFKYLKDTNNKKYFGN